MERTRLFFKKLITNILHGVVKIRLHRHTPIIIGVTGSFGKTSTKEAIAHVLKKKWSIYSNPKSFNTEIGLLLALLEQPSGFRSPLKWARILASGFWKALTGKKYAFLVLEYGADKLGDIEKLVAMVKPNVAVITKIARVHQAGGQFKNEEEVFEEKKKLAQCLGKNEVAILNASDKYLSRLDKKLRAKTFWFGTEKSDIFADEVRNTAQGIVARICKKQKKIAAAFSIPGTYHIEILLPALLVGMLHGISLEEGIRALATFRLPPGRMGIIQGKNDSIILDSSYNASPETVKQALSLLRDFPGKRKIAVLGNMNELGALTEEAHREIGDFIAMVKGIDLLIAVGEAAHFIAEEALKKGFNTSKIETLQRAEEAGDFLASRVTKGDVVLFKGSQNRVRLERAVKMMMKHPEQAAHLLCRQEREWAHIE